MSRRGSRRRYQPRRKGTAKGTGRKDPTRSDPYQRAARAEGYRARSAYKLMQINQRFRILRPGMMVLDLGAAPGGWSQVTAQLVKAMDEHSDENEPALPASNSPEEKKASTDESHINEGTTDYDETERSSGPRGGRVIGIDLASIEPLAGCTFLMGDLTREATLEQVAELCPRGTADAVISDMSPNLSGNYDMDQARSVHLSTTALNIAREWLCPGGSFVVKVFEGSDFVDFRQEVKGSFRQVRSHSPSASRKASSEIYLVAKGFKGSKAGKGSKGT